MKYFKLVMRGDIARIYRRFFMDPKPKNRTEALELINRWNQLVATETTQEGLSIAPVFYYMEAE